MAFSMARGEAGVETGAGTGRALGLLAAFRGELYRCLTARADALFELADAVLCAGAPVRVLAELSLAPGHQRGHGALYDALNCGEVQIARLRRALAGLPLPAWPDGRIRLGVDVSPWLRPEAATSAGRLFCHVYGRGKGGAQMIPGWPFSVVAALEPGRTSWTAVLDAVRLRPDDDQTEVTAAQVRDVVTRLIEAGHWRDGDPAILVVFDAGYDVTRLAWLLAGLPVSVLGPAAQRPGDAAARAAAPARHHGAAPQARRRAGAVRPGDLAGPAGRHQHHDVPVRDGHGRRAGPGAPAADPSRRLAGSRRGPAGHRGHPDPPAGRPAARRPGPQAGVAMVLPHQRHPRRGGPLLAGVLAPF